MAEPNLVALELNITRSAARSDFHPNTVSDACRRGELSFRWENGRRLIRVTDLDAWAARRRALRQLPPMSTVAAP